MLYTSNMDTKWLRSDVTQELRSSLDLDLDLAENLNIWIRSSLVSDTPYETVNIF